MRLLLLAFAAVQMGDLATWYLALGAVTLMAVRRASWRPAV